GQCRGEDIDHLPVAVVDARELAAHALQGSGQNPIFEGCAVAQGTGLARENRHVVPGIVDRLAAPERAGAFADALSVLANYNPSRIGVYINGTPHRAGAHRVLVVVETHQAGLGHRGRYRVEAIKAARIGHKLRALHLVDLPDRLGAELRMSMRFGVSNTLVKQPGVQFVVGLEPQPRGKEALADQPNLVLDLSLLPARRRRARHRL